MVTVLLAVSMIAILGILALAADGGLFWSNYRRVQGASDAAAMAGAVQLFCKYPLIAGSGYTIHDPYWAGHTASYSSAAANGFPSDGVNSLVGVHIPPHTGPFAGRAGYAEVHITYFQKRMFSGIWGSAKIPVRGRAVARARWGGSGKGIVLLDPTAKSSLNASGTGNALVTGGAAVVVNSNDSEAASAMGGGGITAATFEITGGYVGGLHGEIHTGTPPVPNPLAYLPNPTVPPNGNMVIVHLAQGNKQYTLVPGRYTNLPNFNVGDLVILKQASANGAGGIYYIDGGGFKSTGASITMDPMTTGGVMIYNNPTSGAQSEQIQITGNSAGTVNLSALTSGPYAGMLLFQNPTATQSVSVSGGGNFSLVGTFYTANATLQITGGGDAVIGSQYVSRSLSLGGNGTIRINYTDNGTARVRQAILVE